jgi:PadR family transcriptional regulator PadR
MAADTYLGEFEQLVLLAVLRCGNEAYGMAVRRELLARAGRDAAIGAVYATLDRMEEKGLVTSAFRAGGAARGGRLRRCYAVNAAGRRALARSADTVRRMREGLEFA